LTRRGEKNARMLNMYSTVAALDAKEAITAVFDKRPDFMNSKATA
jgi:hypothetical protein